MPNDIGSQPAFPQHTCECLVTHFNGPIVTVKAEPTCQLCHGTGLVGGGMTKGELVALIGTLIQSVVAVVVAVREDGIPDKKRKVVFGIGDIFADAALAAMAKEGK